MGINVENRVTVRLFAGCLLNSELRMHLNQSQPWKQASILPEAKNLLEVHFQNKDYIGQYLIFDKLSIFDLKNIEISIKKTLSSYSGDYNIDSLKICVFTQLFIA